MNTIDFVPLKLDSEDFWFWYNEEMEKFNQSQDEDDERWRELSLYKEKSLYILEYRDNLCCVDIWRGNIPDRAFFELLLKNNVFTKDLNLV